MSEWSNIILVALSLIHNRVKPATKSYLQELDKTSSKSSSCHYQQPMGLSCVHLLQGYCGYWVCTNTSYSLSLVEKHATWESAVNNLSDTMTIFERTFVHWLTILFFYQFPWQVNIVIAAIKATIYRMISPASMAFRRKTALPYCIINYRILSEQNISFPIHVQIMKS